MLTVTAHMWERSAVDSREMWLLLLPHSPSPFFSPCRYYCMPVQTLRPDIGLPLSKSSPSLTGPNSFWVNPSRAGGTSAGSAPHAPHRHASLVTSAVLGHVSPITATQPAFSCFPQESFCWALFLPSSLPQSCTGSRGSPSPSASPTERRGRAAASLPLHRDGCPGKQSVCCT